MAPLIDTRSEIMPDTELFQETLLDRVLRFRNGLVTFATGGTFDGGDDAYKDQRRALARDPVVKVRLPAFVRRCDDLGQFWAFIKHEFPTYQARREYLWGEFRPLVQHLEADERSPGAEVVSVALGAFDAEGVQAAWRKALDRRAADPDGAITAARTLLETVCKHVLDDTDTTYPADADLPKLWGLTANLLNLAPAQHQEKVFREILGSCQSVVNSIGAIRNRVGDAHGQGRRPVKPKPRHAELAVNLAGAMAAFIVATWSDHRLSEDWQGSKGSPDSEIS